MLKEDDDSYVLNLNDSFFDSDDDSGDECNEDVIEYRKNKKAAYQQEGNRDKIVLSILDNGTGIKKQDQKNLFKMFGCLKNTK